MQTIHLPRRRYALIYDVFGSYTVVVKGDDIEKLPKWGFKFKWLGKEKPEITIRK